MTTRNKIRNQGITPPDNDMNAYPQISETTSGIPLGLTVSGMYRGQGYLGLTGGITGESNLALEREEIRFDVDGHYPQMMASGVIRCGVKNKVQWLARLSVSGPNRWSGTIWGLNGNTEHMPWRGITLTVNNTWQDRERRLTAVFTAPGLPSRTRVYALSSRHFNRMEVVVDSVKDSPPVMGFDVSSNVVHPEIIDGNTRTISGILDRTGLRANVVFNQNKNLKTNGATTWSTAEIVDAFRTWARHQDDEITEKTWIMNVGTHELAPEIGSLVMEEIEGRKVNGISIFQNSFRTDVSRDESAINRDIMFAGMHGLGDVMGLGHSWQKRGVGQVHLPGLPLDNEPEVRSFMNDPNRVRGGEDRFFSDFTYRYSDTELMLLRHGSGMNDAGKNLDWYEHHGFGGVTTGTTEDLDLTFRLNRTSPVVQFMEPVTMEMKLTNRGLTPLLVDNDILENQNQLSMIISRNGFPARHLKPVFHIHHSFQRLVLMPGESIFGSVMISVGRGGWMIDDPGTYNIEGILHLDGGDLVARPLLIRVERARSFEEEIIAQDFLTVEMASLISSGGSLLLSNCNDILNEITQRFKGHRVALHAHRLLGTTMVRDHRLLLIDGIIPVGNTVADLGGRFSVINADLTEGMLHLMAAVDNTDDRAIETFGHIGFLELVNRTSDQLMIAGRKTDAIKIQNELLETMTRRNVKKSVIDSIGHTIKRFNTTTVRKAKKASN